MAENDVIRTQVVRHYRQFVAEVDPRGGIMDHLIEAGVVSIETKERLVSHVTRQDRCRAVLDELLGSSHRQAFIVLQRALREHYPWIVDSMNQVSVDDSDCVDSAQPDFITPGVREMAKRLDEVEKNLRRSPTSVERDLQQIDEQRACHLQLMQHGDTLTANDPDLHLRQELDSAKYELRLKSKELSDLKEEMEKLRRDAKTKEMELEKSIDRERLLREKLDQAAVREKLLKQEVRQAVQDERTQLTSLTTDAMLTPAVRQPGDCRKVVRSSPVGQLLDTLHTSSAAVYGITVLLDELYIARDRSNVIEVFDVISPLTSSTCSRRLVVGMTSLQQPVRPLDITSCEQTRSLYVSDAANGRLHRVEAASGRVVDSWRVDTRAWGISVTARATVLVCCRGPGLLCEYSSSGQLVRRVRLPDDITQPVHAVEVSSQFVVSHYDVDDPNAAGARVCVVDVTGAILRDHSQLSQPHHLAVLSHDDQALVAVVDCGNDRVKLLDAATLNVVAVIGGSHQLCRPHRMCVQRERLYVGQWDGRVLVYQLS